MKLHRTFVTALLVVYGVGESTATTVPGSVGDGMPSIYYVAPTGEFGIQSDGFPVGLFDIVSASGIFTADAVLPPDPLFTTNTQFRKSWSALPANTFITDLSLGFIATPGLTLDFLLNDLTILVGGGFGTPHFLGDVVYTIPEPATAAFGALGLLFLGGFRRRRS
jgi:MYXO-CTERM domain-containing protein